MQHHQWTPAAYDDFQRYGFVVIHNQWNRCALQPLQSAFDRLEGRAQRMRSSTTINGSSFVIRRHSPADSPSIERVVWCGASEPLLLQPALDPRILKPALDILGSSSCDQLINQAHFKHPGDQVHFPLHQDAWNRRWGTALWRDNHHVGGYIQIMLNLDPMHADNGPLLVVPGSHHFGPLIGLQRKERLQDIVNTLGVLPVLAGLGSLVFFGPFLIHGSEPNQSTLSRRVLINGYARPKSNRRIYPGAGRGVRRKLPTVDTAETT